MNNRVFGIFMAKLVELLHKAKWEYYEGVSLDHPWADRYARLYERLCECAGKLRVDAYLRVWMLAADITVDRPINYEGYGRINAANG